MIFHMQVDDYVPDAIDFWVLAPLGKAAAAFRQQTAGVSRHVLPKATRLVSRSLPLQLSTRGSHASPVTTNRPTHSQQPVHRKTGSEESEITHTNSLLLRLLY
ncbi:unnamed protein product [Pieris brassicae]|uniref:Uncharacterized protein n=1 Tax=Pieris brassicae TaxID=7116 RepID=A0A9P0TGP6_PIEBR|nr:unnamed protein product [Pieris brassicae]